MKSTQTIPIEGKEITVEFIKDIEWSLKTDKLLFESQIKVRSPNVIPRDFLVLAILCCIYSPLK